MAGGPARCVSAVGSKVPTTHSLSSNSRRYRIRRIRMRTLVGGNQVVESRPCCHYHHITLILESLTP
jgi:hypothetical protein